MSIHLIPLEKIIGFLSLEERYHLAFTCKTLWERIEYSLTPEFDWEILYNIYRSYLIKSISYRRKNLSIKEIEGISFLELPIKIFNLNEALINLKHSILEKSQYTTTLLNPFEDRIILHSILTKEDPPLEENKFEVFAFAEVESSDFLDQEKLLQRHKKILSKLNKEPEETNYLVKAKKIGSVVIILCHGGDFCMAVFSKTGQCVFHKSDHRYVARKKQGRRELNKDKHSKARSMGSQIRRHNEQKHQEAIIHTLKSQSAHLEAASSIYIFTPGLNRLILSSALQPYEHKVNSIGMTSFKANFTEAQRIYTEVTSATFLLKLNKCEMTLFIMVKVLMVAEKPSIAKTIAEALGGHSNSRKGYSQICLVHEFSGHFFDEQAQFLVTSVCGHLLATDFPKHLNNWERVDPLQLFDEKTIKQEINEKGGSLIKHLQNEAAKCEFLVLWLDCDREGENICFEVIEAVADNLKPTEYEQIYRAKFSSLTHHDIRLAMEPENLVHPDENESRSVDARQVLDLKIGVAFTRFQTLFFQGKYGNLDSKLISYGPCQTPTLGFCVRRYDEIQSFRPENYYTVNLLTQTTPVTRPRMTRKAMKNLPNAQAFCKKLNETKPMIAIVTNSKSVTKKVKKPVGLNTVHMLKLASTELGMSPHQAMAIAERLYLDGIITYPRTETTHYAPSFDLMGVISQFERHPTVGSFASRLLSGQFSHPHKGLDAGDHPPITPCRSISELSGSEGRLYSLIVQYFLATVAKDSTYSSIEVTLRFGDEEFVLDGSVTLDPGFSEMMPWACASSKEIPNFAVGQEVPVATVELNTHVTSPPGFLTESELLGLMESHGIGTDASMPVHINNICERNFVRVDANGRKLVPTQLGITLVHGYFAVDKELVLPSVRADIEKSVSLIAKGEASYESVVMHALSIFKQKFEYFRENIQRIDELFEASFSPIAQSSGKPMSRCGRCFRYMVYLPLKPSRLYCNNCEMTYKVPQNGVITPYKERKCPLDNFEIVMFKNDTVSFILCPACFTDSPFEPAINQMSCEKCPKKECESNMSKYLISACTVCGGDMFLTDLSKPKWKVSCYTCYYGVSLCMNATSINVLNEHCPICESFTVKVTYKKNSPFQNSESHVGCVWCDEVLVGLSDYPEERPYSARRRGGGRGGRRGGGGRRRGGGRGGRNRGRRY